MKKILFLTGFAVVGLIFMAATVKPGGSGFGMAKFKWTETTHEFGKIPQGKPVTAEFKFKNSGEAPLVISSVKGSCGCTVTDYTKEAVSPGKEGVVKATFNAASAGVFNKTVTVTANVEGGSETLTIKGEVIPKGKEVKEEKQS